MVLSAQYGEWLRASPATQPGLRPNGPGSAEIQRAGVPLSESGDSSAENQGRDFWDGNLNSCSNRKGRINISKSVEDDSAHKEMLMEAYLAERSVDANPNPNPKLKWDQLTPDLEQIFKNFPYRGPRPKAQPCPDKLSPASNNSSSPLPTIITKSSTLPNSSAHSLNLAQHPPPIAHPPNHTLTQPLTPDPLAKSTPALPLLALPIQHPSTLNFAKPPPSSPPENQTPTVPLLSTTIPSSGHDILPPDIQTPSIPAVVSPTLFDIPITDGVPHGRGRSKRVGGASTPKHGRRRVLGDINGTRLPKPVSYSSKPAFNRNGKRNLENQRPGIDGWVESALTIPETPRKKYCSTAVVASVAGDVSSDMVVETSPKWSPSAQ